MFRFLKRASDERRFSRVDWFICFLLVIAIGISAYYVYDRFGREGRTQEITYTVVIYELDATQAEAWIRRLHVGASVVSENGTASLGTVIDYSRRAHLQATLSPQEHINMLPTPKKIDLYLTVRASATEKEGDGIRVQDIRICAGRGGNFRIGGYYVKNAQIVSVVRGEE